jgi:polygalacturonase
MKSLFTLLMFVVASHCLHARITPNDDSNFNVLKYGATGDGNTDDSDVYIIFT